MTVNFLLSLVVLWLAVIAGGILACARNMLRIVDALDGKP